MAHVGTHSAPGRFPVQRAPVAEAAAWLDIVGGIVTLAVALALNYLLLSVVGERLYRLPELWALFTLTLLPAYLATCVMAALSPSRRWSIGLAFVLAFGVLAYLAAASLPAVAGSVASSEYGFAAMSGVFIGGLAGLATIPESDARSAWLLPAVGGLAVYLLAIGAGWGWASRSAVKMERSIRATVPAFVRDDVAPTVLRDPGTLMWKAPNHRRDVWTEFDGTVQGTGIQVSAVVSHAMPTPSRASDASHWWYLDRVTFTIPQPKPWAVDRPPTADQLLALGLNPGLVDRLKPISAASPTNLLAQGEGVRYTVRGNLHASTVVTVVGAGGPLQGWNNAAAPTWPGRL